MRIGTRLFIGTATVVLAVIGVQWWLQIRQLRALQHDLADVAVSVGESFVFSSAPSKKHGIAVLAPLPPPAAEPTAAPAGAGADQADTPTSGPVVWTARTEVEHQLRSREGKVLVRRVFEPRSIDEVDRVQTVEATVDVAEQAEEIGKAAAAAAGHVTMSRIELKVEGNPDKGNTFLVVTGAPGGDRRIPLPESATEGLIRRTLRDGVVASGALLMVGLLAAAVVSHRVTRPLRDLADGVESVGEGRLGTRVAVTATGEIGDLQRRFNAMSGHLAVLEEEKEAWRASEHLAQLGQLARGLGHTLRNPLNTLGLVVEELAERSGEAGRPLAATARGQIRRIDRWLVSFLALGAGRAAEPHAVDLRDVVRSVALESTAGGRRIDVDLPDRALEVTAVPEAVRAALANLVENAVDASPAEASVEVAVQRLGDDAVVTVRDHGPGLPDEVRERLFSPHVTTKVGGSGMGLFLARQLLDSAHRGALDLDDAPDGGTVATIRLPLAAPDDREEA